MMSGHVDVTCERILTQSHIDPNIHPKNVVYDIDVNDHRLDHLMPSLHSKNIGDQLIELHQMEIDYCGSDNNVGAIIIGVGDSLVTWTVRSSTPHINNACSDDVNCMFSTITVGGYFQLPNIELPEGIIFICAESDSTVAEREHDVEVIHGVAACSNGFVVDRSPPSAGHVVFVSNDGYINSLLHQSIYWYGFTDNSNMFDNGGEMMYRYAIGKFVILQSTKICFYCCCYFCSCYSCCCCMCLLKVCTDMGYTYIHVFLC